MNPASPRPYTLLDMAMTADGKIATGNRAIVSFGSPRDQTHLLELRAGADAVLCGARTAGAPDVTLSPGGIQFQRRRLRAGLAEFNLRVVVSGRARLSPDAAVFSETRSPLVILVSEQASARRCRDLEKAGAVVAPFGGPQVDLAQAMVWLHRQWGVRRLVCEGGARLNDAMFRAGLIDEVHLTLCPLLFGGRQAPTIVDGIGFPTLASAVPLEWTGLRRSGQEIFAVLRVLRPVGRSKRRRSGVAGQPRGS